MLMIQIQFNEIYYVLRFPGDTLAQSITPQKNKALASVGQKVTLSCKYEGAITNLHWYRQYPGSKPEFLAWIYLQGSTSNPLPPRITPKVDRNLVSLEISDAEVTDSALYYCALTPTMTGNSTTLYKNLLNNKSCLSYFLKSVPEQLSVCLGIEPTTFALLMQCSTTEPQEHCVHVLYVLYCVTCYIIL